MHETPSSLLRAGFRLALVGGLLGSLSAQTTAPSEPVTVLEKITVSDVALENQILPTVRPIGSVMGDERSILDTPRAVTSVNKAWMEDRHVHDAMDFGQFSPGVYSSAQYGIPATPQIRGDLGEIFINGQRTNYSRNSVFPSFNGVEALDIVKGPGSAVYGPQGQGPGGYVNLVTKQPYFDAQHTTISATGGFWTSGHSYWNPEVQIDTGGPISSKLAYRASYLSRYGDGYYLNQKNETQDVFFALTYLASPNVKLDWWVQYYASRFNEVSGTNRVTQQFIDNGTYIGGAVNAGPDPFGGGTVTGTFGVLDPATAYTVKLPPYRALIGPEDIARSTRLQSQLITTVQLKGDSKLINRTYLEDRTSKKFETYGYDEWVPKDQSLQDRLEFHPAALGTSVTHKIIAGVDLRYSRLIAYQDFTNEPFFYYDLAKDLSGVFYPSYYDQGKTFGSGLAVPGASGFSGQAYFNTGGNQDTKIFDAAGFIQDDITFNKMFSAVLGVRLDHIHAQTASPAMLEVFNNDTGVLSNPGIPLPTGEFYSASGSENDPSYFGSLIFKPTETRSFYFTYDQVNSVTGSANFGGVHVGASFSGSPAFYDTQLSDSLKAESKLYEAGYKESFLKNTLYVSAALFHQSRMRPDSISSELEQITTKGFEFEAVYQPSKKLTFNANFTYQEAIEEAGFLYEQTGNYLDGYPAGFPVDGKVGTGNGSPNFGGFVPPGGSVRAAGVPRTMANAFVTYEMGHGFGFGVGPQFQGKQNANQEYTLILPSQVEWDGFVYYRTKKWDAQVSVKNILNDRLLDPIDVGFAGNDTVYVRQPISAAFTVRYHL